MKTSSRSILLLLVTLFAVGSATRCYSEYSMATGTLSDCVQGCKDYGTLDAATEACDLLDECTGVSYSFQRKHSQAIGPNSLLGWQLRKGTKLSVEQYNQNNFSFIKKTKVCNKNSPMIGGPIFDYSIDSDCLEKGCKKNSFSIYQTAASLQASVPSGGSMTVSTTNYNTVQYKGQKLTQEDMGVTFFVSGTLCNEYTSSTTQLYEEKRGQIWTLCVDNCKDYSSLKEAQYACNQNKSCSGISYAYIKQGGTSTVGYIQGYSYQLRQGSVQSTQDSSRVISWVKMSSLSQNPLPEEATKKDSDNASNKADNKDTSKSDTKDTGKTDNKDSSKSDKKDSSKSDNNDSSKSDNKDTSKSDNKDSSKSDNKDSSKNENKDSNKSDSKETSQSESKDNSKSDSKDSKSDGNQSDKNNSSSDKGDKSKSESENSKSSDNKDSSKSDNNQSNSSCPTFYTECNYKGDSQVLCENEYPDFTWSNYKSIRVPNNYKVEMFEKDNFGGSSKVVSADDPGCQSNVSFITRSFRTFKGKKGQLKIQKIYNPN